MLRIDAHQHYWRYQPQHYPWIDDGMAVLQQDFGPAQLQPLLQQHRLDGALLVQARHSEAENAGLLAQAAQLDGVCGVVGWLDITAPALDERLAARHPLLCGVRHLVQDEPDPADWLALPAVQRGMGLLQRHGCVYDLLVTHRHLAAAAAFAARHDDHWLVLDHLGKPDVARGAAHWARQIAPLAALPHVACKLSGLITEVPGGHWQAGQLLPFFEAALEAFGPQRLMFGSDWPVCLLAGEYQQVYQLCEQGVATLSPSQQAAIWGGTACRVYGLTGSDDEFISQR
ncbi:amidohydrolase family protein [Serratia odorifera]|jgi:L-fuconolactonase|uniref:Amidohydrolase family protein n=2 Tax=Serratia odorifera TaxID=618 RepID=D4DXJ2_SEROD|nr:amidohydrolase family protein [Serratia odorifera]EFE97735.1 amidohydrolase family protein [Serratia odorifera DSM 4582]MBJ2065278.1 amidohydrolase family protein [Serratia odorifera]PNK92171.1 amidohydrolase [Serratia odorifera]RII73485.1 amidohydrolase [Serratia odorifera]VDZ53001.1 Predicted metal-dependent hydrolase of the TIM-barrel fold [Serratia odorifera]